MRNSHGGDIYTYGEILDFSSNINPVGTPKRVLQAAIEGIYQMGNYPDPLCRELKSAIAKMEGIYEEHIICGNGAADLIFQLVTAKRPKKALLAVPGFTEYQQALEGVGAEIIYYRLKRENNFILEADFLRYLKEDIDMIFLCNPNNPTGKTISIELLDKIIDTCNKRSIFLVIDECFNDFLDYPEKHSKKNKVIKYKNLFILKAFTKMYAMAGLRLGYGLCGDGKLLEKMQRNRQPWSVSIPAQEAGIAALKEVEFSEKTRCHIRKEREYLCRCMKQMGITYWEPEANYIFFYCQLDLKELLLKRNILIRDCSNYIGLEKGYYRIAVKNREDNEKLVNGLRKILGQV